MGAFDGYRIPHYGVLPRGRSDLPPSPAKGFYVSRVTGAGGCIGEWRDTREEADALYRQWVAEGKTEVTRWYKGE